MRGLFRALGLIGVIALIFSAAGVRAQQAAGDWLGTLDASGAQLRLAVHIKQGADGSLTGTLDSLDQGVTDLALAAVVESGGGLTFEVPRVHGRYSGRWDAAKGQWGGTWSQGSPQPLRLARGVAPPAPVIAGLDGDWDGALSLQGIALRLALHVKTGATGTVATLDSIDQATMAIPVAALGRDGDKVRLEVKPVAAVFEGVLSANGGSIVGAWRQGGSGLPLTLNRRAPGSPEAKLNRPQTPLPPFPYRVEVVAFDSPSAGVKLAGTLTIPQGRGPFPAVVLISGSGPNTRNETVFGHQIFLVLADHLTRSGLAVLRYDKRGIGASGGDYIHATTGDFAADAEAAAAYARSRPEIDPTRVGLVGHSEGGLIAPMVAASDPRIAFTVLLAAPGLDGERVLDLQSALIAKAMGQSDAKVAAAGALYQRLYAAVEVAKDAPDATARARAVLAAQAAAGAPPTPAQQVEAMEFATDWFRFFLTYDPSPVLRQVRCPVLALWGSKDLQVPPEEDLPPLRIALAGDRDVTLEVLPGINHLFQTATTGSPAEYATIEETMSPTAMERISAWIVKHVGP